MSFALEVRGLTTDSWPLSTRCLQQIEQARTTGPTGAHAVEVIFGNEDTQDGTLRTLGREGLLKAIDELIPITKKLPGAFEVTCDLPVRDQIVPIKSGGSLSGLLIEGRYHVIWCRVNYWTLQSIDDQRERKDPVPRHEPAEIHTENMGVVKIKSKPARRSDLAKLLREMRRFLQGDLSDTIRVIWG